MAAIVVATLSFVSLCVVRNPKIKTGNTVKSQVQKEQELESIIVKEGDRTNVINSINAQYEQPLLLETAEDINVQEQEQATTDVEPHGLEKLKLIISQVQTECARDPKYIICFFGAAIIRLIAVLFSNFLLLWITSFVDEGLLTEQESKGLYQKVILTSTVATIALLPIMGHMGDKIPSTVIVPISFALRGAVGYSFIWLDDPESAIAQTLCCLLIIFTVIEAVSIEVLLMREIPSAIRGTMMGVFAFFGQLGTLLFTLIGGQMFDRIDRNAPFVFLAIMDSFLVVLALAMTALGKFRS